MQKAQQTILPHKKLYFAGIGGIGISALARLAVAKKAEVWGSDHSASDSTDDLKKLGVHFTLNQKSLPKRPFDAFIYSNALDFNHPLFYEARKRTKQAGFDIDILHTSVYDLPFANASFDAVVMTFVLAEIEHLDQAIAQMKRVLKPGGKVIVIAGGMPQDRNIFARIVFRIVSSGTTLHLERDNMAHFVHHGFSVTREDFGPFNIVNKIVAMKK